MLGEMQKVEAARSIDNYKLDIRSISTDSLEEPAPTMGVEKAVISSEEKILSDEAGDLPEYLREQYAGTAREIGEPGS